MMKRIMKTGVMAVALAASALLASPAVAEAQSRGSTSAELRGGVEFNRGLTLRNRGGNFRRINHGGGFHGPKLNAYGQTPQEVQYLIDQAIYECDCLLQVDAQRYGYVDADFRRPRVEQLGPKKFAVYGRAKLFDGYDYARQPYECLVRRGSIRTASDLYPVRFSNRHRGGFRRGGITLSFGSRW